MSFSSLDQLIDGAVEQHKKLFTTRPTDCGYGAGRINLIGDHTDYNDGLVFPMAVPLYTVVVGSFSPDDQITVSTTSVEAGDDNTVSFTMNDLKVGQPSCMYNVIP